MRKPHKPPQEAAARSNSKHDGAKPCSGGGGGGVGAGLHPLISVAGMVLAFAVGWGGRGMQGVGDVSAGAATALEGRHAFDEYTTTAWEAWEHTTHPGMATVGFNWTQLSMSRENNFNKQTFIKEFTVDDIAAKDGAFMLWHKTYARSIPAVIRGLGKRWSDTFDSWTLDDYEAAWGDQRVVVAYSPDWEFQRGVPHPTEHRVLQAPDRQQVLFRDWVKHVRAYPEHKNAPEHTAVQQSPSRDFSEFGLPALPPHLEALVGPTLNARNFWAATPPKRSTLHYDWQDSLLMQLAGVKKFTIVDPARLHTAYPCVQKMLQLKRTAPGVFTEQMTERELDNFPLVNVTHPDFERHPLYKDSHVFTVEMHPGDALVLPSYWYHQVESFAEPGKLCVAVNYWFQGHSLVTRLYRTLRENVFINCTEPAKPGEQHPCGF
tara:strand:- start:1506 stop:2804 length:1299 start_codon:yes stop_codon:yes gene_type:complete